MSAKGELRRQLLVEASAAVLQEKGPSGVTHRAVASQGGLPLASTTYYFGSRDDLLLAAMEEAVSVGLEAAEAVLAAVKPGKRSAKATATLLLKIVTGGTADAAGARALEERALVVTREPALAPAVQRWITGVTLLLRDALARSERPVTARTAGVLLAVVDGVVISALAEGAAYLSGAASKLATVLDALAPASA
jgi:DNA-binding transcriptional regulator YbjK